MPHVVPLSMLVATNRPTTGERCVGRTHTTVRLQTRIRRKDGTENFGVSYLYWICTTGFYVVGFCVLG